jgi:ubiquitin-activating enzyme E1
LTDTPLSQQIAINDYCHKKGICFLTADTFGAFAWAFADFGSEFIVHDKDGEESDDVLIRGVTKSERGIHEV